MNGLTLLVAIVAFFAGRGFQYLLTQASDSKWQRKPERRYKPTHYYNSPK